jgi:hypothetical protein
MMRLVPAALLVFACALTGCLASETKVIEYDVVRDGHLGSPIDVSATAVDQASVDLERIRAYEENRGDIQLVDRLGSEATIGNPGGAAATMSVYLSERDTLTDPAHEAALLLPMTIPAGGGRISYRDSEDQVENFSTFQKAVKDGTFVLYFVTDAGGNLTVTEMSMIVTMTVRY